MKITNKAPLLKHLTHLPFRRYWLKFRDLPPTIQVLCGDDHSFTSATFMQSESNYQGLNGYVELSKEEDASKLIKDLIKRKTSSVEFSEDLGVAWCNYQTSPKHAAGERTPLGELTKQPEYLEEVMNCLEAQEWSKLRLVSYSDLSPVLESPDSCFEFDMVSVWGIPALNKDYLRKIASYFSDKEDLAIEESSEMIRLSTIDSGRDFYLFRLIDKKPKAGEVASELE